MGPRFEAAVAYAAELHRTQFRKATRVPYLAHLLAVAALVLEQDGDEDEAIAGLLHDAVEDQGGAATLEAIRAQFGAPVASIVAGCTETDQDPKPPWQERKEAYLEHLRHETAPGVLRVSLADKLHNLQSMLRDHTELGAALWARFNAGPGQQLWYYESLAAIFDQRLPGPFAREFRALVAQLAAVVEPMP